MSQPSPPIERISRQKPAPEQRSGLLYGISVKSMALGVSIGLGGFLLAGVLLVASVFLYFYSSDQIMPGVFVGDVRVGNMSIEEASSVLAQGWTGGQTVYLTTGANTWATSSDALGVEINTLASAKRASEVGTGQDIITAFQQFIMIAWKGYTVAPVVGVNADTARVELQRWTESIYTPPQNATVRLEAGDVVPVPGLPGYIIDVELTLGVLLSNPEAVMQAGELPVQLAAIPPDVPDPGAAVAEAEAILSSPLSVVIYDAIIDERHEFAESREMIASLLTVANDETGPHIALSEERVAAYLDELSRMLGEGRYLDVENNLAALSRAVLSSERAVMMVQHDPTTYTVAPGDTLIRVSWKVGMPYWRIMEVNPDLDIDSLSVGQVLNIPSKDDLLPLPVVMDKRLVVSISRQRLWAYENGQMVGEYIISTGIEDSPTQPGIFQVQSHEVNAYASVWDLQMPHFIGIYEAWPGFMNGFHGLPSRDGGQVLWANSLGRPTSFGCIILDKPNAAWLFDWAEQGVVVVIEE